MREAKRQQTLPVRLTHWANVVLLVIMAGSGLQIFAAFPTLGPQGRPYPWFPMNGLVPPKLLMVGGWLAGGRAWHFAFGWFFVATGAAYLAYLFASGEWRRRLFLPRRDGRNALRTAAYYLRLRPKPAGVGLYNGLQRMAYTGTLLVSAITVATGLAIYKPVQLRWLALVFGGYDSARAIHLLGLVALAIFVVAHVILVLLHPRALASIVTGGPKGPVA